MFDASTAELLVQQDLLGSPRSDASRFELSFQEGARRNQIAVLARGHIAGHPAS